MHHSPGRNSSNCSSSSLPHSFMHHSPCHNSSNSPPLPHSLMHCSHDGNHSLSSSPPNPIVHHSSADCAQPRSRMHHTRGRVIYGNFLPDISYVCLLIQSPPWIFVTSSHAIFLQIVQTTWWFDGLRAHSFSVALQTRVAVAKEFSGWEYIVDANISESIL